MKSIANRIHRSIFIVSVVSIVVMVLTILIVNEDLEQTMLKVEFSEERDFFLGRHQTSEPIVWETANLTVVYIPQGKAMPAKIPAIFDGLPEDFTGELKRGKKTILVHMGATEKGRLYIAKDITHFESREILFIAALGVVIASMLFLALLLGILGSRRIVTPLRQLSDEISNVPVGQNMPRIPLGYQDAELHTIAESFNRFLGELESFVKREQSLLNLASHELRTPLAVISGALDIVEQRDQLGAADKATISRIRGAVTEMGANVNMLLSLARRETSESPKHTVAIATLLDRALEDISINYDVRQRVKLIVRDPVEVSADPLMAQMLLRNLIQNALQHTTRAIQVRLLPGLIEISDEGTGLTADQQAILTGRKKLPQDGSPLSGLGLYIVTLMCERLQWRLQVPESTSSGTTIQIRTTAQAEQNPAATQGV